MFIFYPIRSDFLRNNVTYFKDKYKNSTTNSQLQTVTIINNNNLTIQQPISHKF